MISNHFSDLNKRKKKKKAKQHGPMLGHASRSFCEHLVLWNVFRHITSKAFSFQKTSTRRLESPKQKDQTEFKGSLHMLSTLPSKQELWHAKGRTIRASPRCFAQKLSSWRHLFREPPLSLCPSLNKFTFAAVIFFTCLFGT